MKLKIIFFFFWMIPVHSMEKCYDRKTFDDFKNSFRKFFIEKSEYDFATLIINKVPVDMYIPKKLNEECTKTLLVLPGWKFSRKRWFQETELIQYITNQSYVALAPETSVTIYESKYYPETKLKWHPKPGLKFFLEDFFPFFRTHQIFLDLKMNFALGLSTGGRGVVMIATQLPDLFISIATLSGDFDQTITPHDNLMKLVYGPYETFPYRWEEDNPFYYIQKNGWKTNLYIGHGKEDPIVSFQHSLRLYEFLSQKNNSFKIVFSLREKQKHDFLYWNSELSSIFDFFEKTSKMYKK